MSDTIFSTVREQLNALEQALAAVQLWDAQPPSPEALQSTIPFMYDTLRIEQWLQWVFIPRMHALLDAGADLPDSCSIHPLAEHEWSGRATRPVQVLATLAHLDALLMKHGGAH